MASASAFSSISACLSEVPALLLRECLGLDTKLGVNDLSNDLSSSTEGREDLDTLGKEDEHVDGDRNDCVDTSVSKRGRDMGFCVESVEDARLESVRELLPSLLFEPKSLRSSTGFDLTSGGFGALIKPGDASEAGMDVRGIGLDAADMLLCNISFPSRGNLSDGVSFTVMLPVVGLSVCESARRLRECYT